MALVKTSVKTTLPLILLLLLNSCASTITSALIGPALDNMQEQSDVQLVCEGTPSYLLMIDSLIAGDPFDTTMLTLGTKSYGGYLSVMDECDAAKQRKAAMAEKAKVYSDRLLTVTLDIKAGDSFEIFGKKLENSSKYDADALFWAAFGWISWLQQQDGSPASMAGLGKVELLLLKIVELDDDVENGMAHFLLGTYYGIRPTMLGGKPEKSKFHFSRALQISERKILIYQTMYAQTYARNTLNKELHNSLLNEVVDFPVESNRSRMLANIIAKRKAEKLLAERFFDE